MVFAGKRRRFRIAAHCTVQFDAPGANQFRSLRARAIPHLGERTREPHSSHFLATVVFCSSQLHGVILLSGAKYCEDSFWSAVALEPPRAILLRLFHRGSMRGVQSFYFVEVADALALGGVGVEAAAG